MRYTTQVYDQTIDLDSKLQVTVPKKSECVFFVEYSIPAIVYAIREDSINVDYVGITLYKGTQELPQGSRKFTV